MRPRRPGPGVGPDDLHDAVRRACVEPGSLRTLFQPIVDVAHGTVTGYEALTRIDLEPRMSPDRWFAAADAAGLGPALEARALASALAARPALPANCFLTVNLGPDALLAPAVRAVLAAEPTLRGLVLELTEQAAVEDYPRLQAALGPLRAAGALLAVDDAGAGYASLKHVMTLRPEFVKLDRALITDIDRDETKAAVVDGLGHVASRLDAWIIAEGIETPAELERLAALGVPLAQGYLTGRPAPGMATTSPAAAAIRAEAVEREAFGVLGPLLSRALCVAEADGRATAAEALFTHPGEDVAVVVDAHRHPVRLEHRARRREDELTTPPLCTGPRTTPAELARRVVARPGGRRFDPIVCCDERGRVVGLLRVERLLTVLADATDRPPG